MTENDKEILKQIKIEVNKRRKDSMKRNEDPYNNRLPDDAEARIGNLLRMLDHAQSLCNTGTAIPEFNNYRGIKKKVARKVAKIYLRISQIITTPQRSLNHLIIQLLMGIVNEIKFYEANFNKKIKLLS
jgi:hypothetical protein